MAKTPINRYIGNGANSYTIPAGKHFYGRAHGTGGPVSCTVNGKDLSVNNSAGKSSIDGSIVLKSGDVIANNQTVNFIHLQGFLADTEDTPVPVSQFIGSGESTYTVPVGKHFVGRIHGNGGAVTCSINSRDVTVKNSSGEPAGCGSVVLASGDVVANSQSVNYVFLMGFLYNN